MSIFTKCSNTIQELDDEREYELFDRYSGEFESEMEDFEFDQSDGDFEYEDDLQGEINRKSRSYIKWVQRSLNKIINAGLAVDGISGPLTKAAVRRFQYRARVAVDGIVGPQTEGALLRAGADPPPGTAVAPPVAGSNGFIIGGSLVASPAGLNVTNFNSPRVARFTGRRRRVTVNELIIHESVTRSVADTVSVLRNRGLGVHLIIGPDGRITQHGDLLSDNLGHANPHNTRSVGVEVVNPYYPRNLRSGLPWSRTIAAGWAHERRYVLPTPAQAEATALLIAWITSPGAPNLSIPRNWIGVRGNSMSMSRVTGADRARPGVYAHTYFNHADGAWLILYAWLRIERRLSSADAYNRAVQLATTTGRTVALP